MILLVTSIFAPRIEVNLPLPPKYQWVMARARHQCPPNGIHMTMMSLVRWLHPQWVKTMFCISVIDR